MLTIITFRNVGNYNFPKGQQLYFPEMLAIMTTRTVEKLSCPEMLAILISRNVSNYNFPKDQQLWFPEMLAIMTTRTVDKYNIQKCWQL